jgi:hypothetical protein
MTYTESGPSGPSGPGGAAGWGLENEALVSKGGNDSIGAVGDPSRAFLTIQAAIDACSAGQNVGVLPGTYVEQLTMKDGVSVYAKEKENTIIRYVAAASGSTIVMALNMRLVDFTVQGVANATFTNKLIDWGSSTAHMSSVAKNCRLEGTGAGDTILADLSAVAGVANESWYCMQDCIGTGVSASAGRGVVGGGTTTTNHAHFLRCSFYITGTGGIAADVVGLMSMPGCYLSGPTAWRCLSPKTDNELRYDATTKWNGATVDGGQLTRYATSYDHALQSKSAYVDGVFGDDDTAILNDPSRPFATIQKAIDESVSGMIVEVGPGMYDPFVCKVGVSVRGLARQKCIITSTAAGAAMVTFAASCVVERFQLNPAPASGTATGAVFSGTDNASSVLRECDINGSGAGTTNGIDLSAATGSVPTNGANIEDVQINVNGTDIVPHSSGGNAVRGNTRSTLAASGKTLLYTRYTPGVNRRVGLQLGDVIIPFELKDVGSTGAASRGNVRGLSYDDAVAEESFWEVKVDERYIDLSTVTFKIEWYNAVTQTGGAPAKTCKWRLDYTSLVPGDVAPATPEVTNAVVDADVGIDEVAYTYQSSDLLFVPASHVNDNHRISLTVKRDPTDTLVGDAVLCGVFLVPEP